MTMVCYIALGLSIMAYANANYAGDPNDCHPTRGILNFPRFKETKKDLPFKHGGGVSPVSVYCKSLSINKWLKPHS